MHIPDVHIIERLEYMCGLLVSSISLCFRIPVEGAAARRPYPILVPSTGVEGFGDANNPKCHVISRAYCQYESVIVPRVLASQRTRHGCVVFSLLRLGLIQLEDFLQLH